MKEEKSKSLIYSHLTSDYGKFVVSTIYRQSSAMLSPGNWYYETFAWKAGDKWEKLEQVADNSGALNERNALEQHNDVCKELLKSGIYPALTPQ